MSNKYFIYLVLLSSVIIQPFYLLYAQEIKKPHLLYLGQSANASQINENFDGLYNTLNQINLDKYLWLDQLVKPYPFNNDQPASSAQINQNFDELFSQINSVLTIYDQATVTKPNHFISGTIILHSQINENFELLYLKVNSISQLEVLPDPTPLNSNFDDLFEKVSGWLVKVSQPGITKAYTFVSGSQPAADQLNDNFDPLYTEFNKLLTGIHQPTITKPYHFINGTQSDADQINQNFDGLFSAANELSMFFKGIVEMSIPDTGQTTCYDSLGTVITCPAPGQPLAQDGSYTNNPPSYTDNGDGTVTDNVTGLIWQQTDDNSRIARDNALNYCDSNTAGLPGSGWRLPTIKELTSIRDLGKINASISSTFSNVKSEYYWSSTTYNDVTPWFVDFRYGSVIVYGQSHSAYFYARCVRGGETTQNNAFYDNNDGTITDLSSGLTWQQGESSPMSWEAALAYCENESDLGGKADWRLPNANELQSLIDYSKHDPAIDQTYFSYPEDPYYYPNYWSSTTDVIKSTSAWFVYLHFGAMLGGSKGKDYYARCVRGGQ